MATVLKSDKQRINHRKSVIKIKRDDTGYRVYAYWGGRNPTVLVSRGYKNIKYALSAARAYARDLKLYYEGVTIQE